MAPTSKRKRSLTLDAVMRDCARDLGNHVSAVAAALQLDGAEARRSERLVETAEAFAAQAAWHEINGHPLAAIMTSPVGQTWER